jgi:hypothetical protein
MGRHVNSMAVATRNAPFPLPVCGVHCAAARIAEARAIVARSALGARDETHLFLLFKQGKTGMCGLPSGADSPLPWRVEVGCSLLLQGICRRACSGSRGIRRFLSALLNSVDAKIHDLFDKLGTSRGWREKISAPLPGDRVAHHGARP